MEFKIDFTYNKLLAGLKMFQPRGQTYWEDDSVDVSLTRIFELITRIRLQTTFKKWLIFNLIPQKSEKFEILIFFELLNQVWDHFEKITISPFSTVYKDKIPYRYTWFRCNGSSNLWHSRMETTSCVNWSSDRMVTLCQFLPTLGKFKLFAAKLITIVNSPWVIFQHLSSSYS